MWTSRRLNGSEIVVCPFKRSRDTQTVIIYNSIMYVRFIDLLLRFEKPWGHLKIVFFEYFELFVQYLHKNTVSENTHKTLTLILYFLCYGLLACVHDTRALRIWDERKTYKPNFIVLLIDITGWFTNHAYSHFFFYCLIYISPSKFIV